jgi:hypothetical protein
MEKGFFMTHQQLKQATIEIRHQLEREIESQIRKLDPIASTEACQAFQADYPRASKDLEDALHDRSEKHYQALTKEIAYTWFNRLCALRYMDLLHYTPIQVVSGSSNEHLPDVLWETKQGILPQVYLQNSTAEETLQKLLNGTIASTDPDTDIYQLLLQEACHYFHSIMPFLFDSPHALTDFIMPAHLLDATSVLAKIQNLLTEETVLHSMQESQNSYPNSSSHSLSDSRSPSSSASSDQSGMVEIVGWLYQYYQTEDHDAMYNAFKKNYKASAPDLPAATQLYTPEWIVRYMVDNSLGRLWLQYKPHSKLTEKLQYYIQPQQPETDLLPLSSPQDITFCDPACGSGHILTYAFDVLYAIYEEEGYTPHEIPSLILNHNLWGMDIDKRACQLASFALFMKARSKDKRFFSRLSISPYSSSSSTSSSLASASSTSTSSSPHSSVSSISVEFPHIHHLHSIRFQAQELEDFLMNWNPSLDWEALTNDLLSLQDASGIGSLLKPKSTAEDIEEFRSCLIQHLHSSSLSLQEQTLLPSLLQATATLQYLSQKYCVVCTNPPYLGAGKLTEDLKKFLASNYKEGKSDLCTCFILRNFDYLKPNGYNAMVTMQSWMFLSSFEELRKQIVEEKTILCLVQMTNGVMKIAFGTSAFVIKNQQKPNYKGQYSFVQLEDIRPPDYTKDIPYEHPYTFPVPNERLSTASSSDFHKIPGSPIAYWVSKKLFELFEKGVTLKELGYSSEGVKTGNNELFLRFWNEISICKSNIKSFLSEAHWCEYHKGGEYRKWYGNFNWVINWLEDGKDIKNSPNSGFQGKDLYFENLIVWSKITSRGTSFRFLPDTCLFDSRSPVFCSRNDLYAFLAYLNSSIINLVLSTINPTLNCQVGNITNLPYMPLNEEQSEKNHQLATTLISLSKSDWDAYERSWNFARLPLLLPEFQRDTIEESYKLVRWHWHEMTCEMHKLEVENNQLFNKAYGLEDEISSDVPMQEITLTCNPAYRYPDTRTSQRSLEEKEKLLLEDTMKEYVSYFVGCLLGRYSLDIPGLVLANQGDTIQTYLDKIPSPTFMPDENNVVPILDDIWFHDDIVHRFYEFIKHCFGEKEVNTNVQYIEQVLGKSIRQYFIKDFYKDHVSTYQKRPIYWLFSSDKGSFQALIYMHRYTKDTPSIVLRYLRDYMLKLNEKIASLQRKEVDATLSTTEQNKARKEIDKLEKVLKELHSYEKDILYPLATQRIEIDLDDGVKHNYPLLGKSLKKVPGLSE